MNMIHVGGSQARVRVRLRPNFFLKKTNRKTRKKLICLAAVASVGLLSFSAYSGLKVGSNLLSLLQSRAPGKGQVPGLPEARAHSVSELRKIDTRSGIPELRVLKGGDVKGGVAYHVPSHWNRLHVPWFRRKFVRMLTREESNYRYLYAPTRIATSDGIGHSMGVVNYAFNFALRFNLTYTHRVGMYSSLTASEPLAVEKFFGWGDNEVPRGTVQSEGCVPRNGTWPTEEQKYDCHICDAPLYGGSLGIKHIVNIPQIMEYNCHCAEEICEVKTAAYVRLHPHRYTIFQTPLASCRSVATDSNFLKTKNLFFYKYWNRHGWLPWTADPISVPLRPVRYDEKELNVAVHIRRGDFLDPKTRTHRVITEDRIYAKVLAEALLLVNDHGDVFAEMPVAIHIYSEGKLSTTRVSSVHAIELQDHNYYDSDGVVRDAVWWNKLILATKASNGRRFSTTRVSRRLRVVLHISEDTLLCLHEMVSADIFIGSQSGLSNSLVWSLSRGVVLIPPSGPLSSETGKQGLICCSMAFNNENGTFSQELFRKYWAVYAGANSLSARRATSA